MMPENCPPLSSTVCMMRSLARISIAASRSSRLRPTLPSAIPPGPQLLLKLTLGLAVAPPVAAVVMDTAERSRSSRLRSKSRTSCRVMSRSSCSCRGLFSLACGQV